MSDKKPINALEVPPRTAASVYPEVFAKKVEGRVKRALGDYFSIQKFGVNLTELPPGVCSALFHKHSLQEEMIYILKGNPTLYVGNEKFVLEPGMCAGFTPNGEAHQLINESNENVLYLEIGDRVIGDEGIYPKDDLVAKMGDNKKWIITKKDGTPY